MNRKLINTYSLPPVANVCDQILREVTRVPEFSLAHVIMEGRNVSLWHRHLRMDEVYFVLDGKGVLYHGERALEVKRGACLAITPGVPHKLRNTGEEVLEHLVLALPPFDPNDVEVLKDSSNNAKVERFVYGESFVARDGALIYGSMSDERIGISLAYGILAGKRKANPHFHNVSDEIYYIIDGKGIANVGKEKFEIEKGSVVCVPKNEVHSLENTSARNLEVLCICWPPYSDGDFHLV